MDKNQNEIVILGQIACKSLDLSHTCAKKFSRSIGRLSKSRCQLSDGRKKLETTPIYILKGKLLN